MRKAMVAATMGLTVAALLPPPTSAGEPPPGATGDPVVLRVVLAGRKGPHAGLSPLFYWGGFQTKTLVYEPLVRHGPSGELVPGLAESWTQSPDGRTWTFRLREGLQSHDGEPLDAAAVRDHALRVMGNPGNRWIGATDRLRSVEATDARTVVATLSEPWNLARECAIVNPWHVVPPGAFDHEGFFRNTVGTGPFRLVEEDPGVRQVYEANPKWWGGKPGVDRIEARLLPNAWRENHEVLQALFAGEVDLVADGEGPVIPREELDRAKARGFRIWRRPGSSVTYLRLNVKAGPMADRGNRRRLAAAVDRAALVRDGELGYAEPTATMFRAGYAGWPKEAHAAPPDAGGGRDPLRLRLLVNPGASRRIERHAALLREQAKPAGIDLAIEFPADAKDFSDRLESGAWDVAFSATNGAPYDPWISLQAIFLNEAEKSRRTASRSGAFWEDAAMRASILAAEAAVDDTGRGAALAAAQARLDEEVPVVPLLVSDRIAVSVAGLEGLEFGTNAYDLGLASVRIRRP